MLKPEKPQPKPQIKVGSYPARLYSIIELGTDSYPYNGEIVYSKKIRLSFELPTELHEFKEGEGEKPYVISKEFGFTMGQKSKLRPVVESFIGKAFKSDDEAFDFDIESLLGKDCMLSVIENKKGYSEIGTISPLPKGMTCPEAFNAQVLLSFNNWNEEIFNRLPEFVKNKISDSPEYISMREREEYPEGIKTENEHHVTVSEVNAIMGE